MFCFNNSTVALANSIVVTPDDQIFITVVQNGVYQFSRWRNQWINLDLTANQIVRAPDGEIWLAMGADGVAKFDAKTGIPVPCNFHNIFLRFISP